MALGFSQFGPYGYFNIPGAMNQYQGALTDLAGAQRESQRMRFPDFMQQLAQMLMQFQQQRQEQQRWEQEFDVEREYRGALGDMYRARIEEMRKPEVPVSPYQKLPGEWPLWSPEEKAAHLRKEAYGQPPTPKETPQYRQIWHWLGQPASKTPRGIATSFKNQGYRVVNDKWVEAEEKKEHRKDPLWKTFYESVWTKMQADVPKTQGRPVSAEDMYRAAQQADELYFRLQESTPNPELNMFFR